MRLQAVLGIPKSITFGISTMGFATIYIMDQMRNNPEQESAQKGAHYLSLIGLSDLVGQTFETSRGPIHAENFLDICGEHALPALMGFETLELDDPRREVMSTALQKSVKQYLNISGTE